MGGKKKGNEDKAKLYFIGNNSVSVTGSCIYGEFLGEKFLLELGGSQEGTVLENYRNNEALLNKIDFENISYIFLQHFHIDHTFLVPAAIRRGFKGKIVTNHKTARILKDLWADSCHINKTDVEYLRNVKGVRVEPFYKEEDLHITMEHVCEYTESEMHKLSEHISFRLLKNNHVLGSTSLELFFKDNSSKIHKCFYSSDLGNLAVDKYFVFNEVETCNTTNVAILESTYNDKNREPITKKLRKEDLKILEDTIINTITVKKGSVILPCFAVDRTQNILVYIKQICDKREELKDVQVVVDGKLTSKIMKAYSELLEDEQLELFEEILNWKNLKIISDFQTGTRAVLSDPNPKIVVSSSGFAEKGHIVEYLKHAIVSEKNTAIFSGYSSPTSLASRLKEKITNPAKDKIMIDKMTYRFKCEIVQLQSFSSHIQRKELINLMKQMSVSDKIILVHGDIEGRRELAKDSMEECMKVNKTTRIVSAERNMKIEF